MTISQEDAKSYMRCFADMGRRMGLVGEALGCPEDADPEDILDEAKRHSSFVRRLIGYVLREQHDLASTAVSRWLEEHPETQVSGVGEKP